MKKGGILSVLIVLTLLLSFTGCIFDDKDDDNNNWYQSANFTIEIIIIGTGQINVTVPLLVYQNGSVSNLMNDLKILEGSGNFEIIQSEKGNALRISTNSNIILNSKLEKSKGKDYIVWQVLSLEKDTNYNGDIDVSKNDLNYFVLLKNTTNPINVELNIKFEASQYNKWSGSDTLSECNGMIYPDDKWQTISGFRGVEMWDK